MIAISSELEHFFLFLLFLRDLDVLAAVLVLVRHSGLLVTARLPDYQLHVVHSLAQTRVNVYLDRVQVTLEVLPEADELTERQLEPT